MNAELLRQIWLRAWRRHFRWKGAFLLGRTAHGRVTISLLRINDPFHLELRQSLIAEGLFPLS